MIPFPPFIWYPFKQANSMSFMAAESFPCWLYSQNCHHIILQKKRRTEREREREGWNVKHAYLIIDMQGKCDGDTWAMHKWLLGLTVLDLKIFLCQFRTPDSAKVLHAWILWLLWESKNLSWCRLLIRLSQANVVEGVKMENQIN